MKERLLPFLFLCFAFFTIQAQTVEFNAPPNVFDGPYMELTSDGFNLYSWYKRQGFMSNKLGILSQGDNQIEVSLLEVQEFNNSGKLIKSASYGVRLEDGGSGIGKYKVHSKSLGRGELIASASDMTMEELLRKFPSSQSHSGATASKAVRPTKVKVSGKGLIGMKPPYTMYVEKSGEKGVDFPLANLPSGDPKAEWKTLITKLDFKAGEEIVMPVWYSKFVKKDRFSQTKAFKLVNYDGSGKEITNKEISFKAPNEMQKTIPILDKQGNKQGLVFVFTEMFGLGWKKVNPEPQKDLNNLYWIDAKGGISEGIELRARGKSNMPTSPSVLAAFQSEGGFTLLIPAYKDSKKGIAKDALDEYLCQGTESKLVKSYDYADIIRSTDGKKKPDFLGKMGDYKKQLSLTDGSVLHMGYDQYQSSSTGQKTYGECHYLLTNPDGTLRYIGKVERGVPTTTAAPRISLEELSDGRVLVSVKNYKQGSTLWIFSPSTGEFTKATPKTPMRVVETMKKDGTIHFIGVVNEDKRVWAIEKYEL